MVLELPGEKQNVRVGTKKPKPKPKKPAVPPSAYLPPDLVPRGSTTTPTGTPTAQPTTPTTPATPASG